MLFDATHSVQDRLEFPSAASLAMVQEASREDDERVLVTVAADVAKAHRRCLCRETDFGYLGCRAKPTPGDDPNKDTVWLNRVGTFAPLCTLAGWLGPSADLQAGRCCRNMLTSFCLQMTSSGLLGVHAGISPFGASYSCGWLWARRFSWHKFRGGISLDYVGFYCDYARFAVGISERRSAWFVEWVDAARRDQWIVAQRGFVEFLGRLSFAAQALGWLRPFLAPLFAWSAVLSVGMTAALPTQVRLTLVFIQRMLVRGNYTVSCSSPARPTAQAFRTDAKCATGSVVLGGWSLGDGADPGAAKWFSLELSPTMAPWLFGKDNESKMNSTVAELLAVYVALRCFGFLESEGSAPRVLSVCGGTDNLAIDYLSRSRSTTRFPLALVNMQLWYRLFSAKVWLHWRPRGENQLADDLTNGDFGSFSIERRVPVTWQDIDVGLLEEMLEAQRELEEALVEARQACQKGRS